MTIEELEKKLAELDKNRIELQEQIKELKEKPTPPHPMWKPKEIENYYVIMSDGTSDTRISHASIDEGIFIRRYSIGNVFKTKEAAEFAIERLKVLAEMRVWAGNWDDTYTIACVKVMSEETRIIVNDKLSTISNGEMRFATEEDAEGCIKAVGEDRLKKYYFMIPEKETNNDESTV